MPFSLTAERLVPRYLEHCTAWPLVSVLFVSVYVQLG